MATVKQINSKTHTVDRGDFLVLIRNAKPVAYWHKKKRRSYKTTSPITIADEVEITKWLNGNTPLTVSETELARALGWKQKK